MPTAAITESSENTMSITAICAITIANEVAALPVPSTSSCSPSTSERISMMPFTTRNRPPRISTRSRTETPCPNSVNRSLVSPASQASVSNRPRRVMQATAMPNFRANSRRSAGSRLTAIEMNTRLSMPSTISIVARVTSRIHTCGSEISSIIACLSFGSRSPCGARGSWQSWQQQRAPDQQYVEHQHEDRRRAHVLGAAGKLVVLGAVAVDDRFDRRIQQFRRQHQHQAAHQERAFDAVAAKPQAERRQQGEQAHLEPERGLVEPGRAQALQLPGGRLQHACRAAGQVSGLVGHKRAILPQGGPRGRVDPDCARGAAPVQCPLPFPLSRHARPRVADAGDPPCGHPHMNATARPSGAKPSPRGCVEPPSPDAQGRAATMQASRNPSRNPRMRRPAAILGSIAVFVTGAAMNPSFAQATPQPMQPGDAGYEVVLDAATRPLREALGGHVELEVERMDRVGGWAFVLGNMRAPGGGRPDLSRTAFAEASAQGAMSDAYVVLLRH